MDILDDIIIDELTLKYGKCEWGDNGYRTECRRIADRCFKEGVTAVHSRGHLYENGRCWFGEVYPSPSQQEPNYYYRAKTGNGYGKSCVDSRKTERRRMNQFSCALFGRHHEHIHFTPWCSHCDEDRRSGKDRRCNG